MASEYIWTDCTEIYKYILIISEVKKNAHNNFTTGRKIKFLKALWSNSAVLGMRGDSIFHKPLEFMEAYKYVHMCNV